MIKPHATRIENRTHDEGHDVPIKFGDQLTADTLIAHNRLSEAVDSAKYGQVMHDVATKHNSFYPQATKTEEDAVLSLQHYAGKTDIKLFYSDNAPELMRAAKLLCLPHDTSIPEIS